MDALATMMARLDAWAPDPGSVRGMSARDLSAHIVGSGKLVMDGMGQLPATFSPRRRGYDLTFNAPMSFSMAHAALVQDYIKSPAPAQTKEHH